MTPKKIMEAYKAVNELANCVFPYKVTRQVHKLKKKLEDEFEAILDAEKALVSKHGGEFRDGTYKFGSLEVAEAFNREYMAFLEQESEVHLPKVDVSKCLGSVTVSAYAIDALEGIVDFGEE